jgi:predicted Zn finger-like uncharacterized protein
MKFVCDRCLTKYSIADEKVRGRILKIRCKSCSNIITVKESAPSAFANSGGDSDRTVITSGPHPPAPSPVPAVRAKPEGRPIRPPTLPPAGAGAGDDIQWFLAIEGVQTGPFSRKALVDKLTTLPKDSDVHVWNDNLDGWKPPRDVPAVARDLQARQRSAPQPPPPPRLRPVPPPPSQSPAHHAPATQHGAPVHHAPVSHSRGLPNPAGGSSSHLSLGAASAAPLPGTPTSSAMAALDTGAMVVDTPAPMKELVQAHRAHNGEAKRMSASSMAAVGGTPAVALANGESDALQALNLGGGWRQPGAPEVGTEFTLPSSSIALATAAGVRVRQRNLKLLSGFVGIVGVVVIVLFIALRKPPTPASAANGNTLGEGAGTTGQPSLGEGKPGQGTTGQGTPGAQNTQGNQGAQGNKEGTPGALGAGSDPHPGDNAGDPDPAGGGMKLESVARISAGKKPLRPGLGRGPGRGALSATTPGALNPSGPAPAGGYTPEQLAAMNRFGDTSTKSLQLRNAGGSVAKVTPAQGDITRVVNNNKGGIKVCYQRALLRDNTLTHGKIDVRVSIGISGRVKNVGIDGPSSFRSLDPCIKDVLSRWVFPASSEEYGTEFSYLFQGNE